MIFLKIVSEKHMKRFYVLGPVEKTLFDDLYAVRLEYGRIDGMRRFKVKLFESSGMAQKYHDRCYSRRISHGYECYEYLGGSHGRDAESDSELPEKA
ncbi:MAG: hypothetical protein C0176_08190 [Mesoaciditoga sp.]|nr:MAG: hypothetical protein C0176_08190 [Mesoaciditoga sp.]